MKPRRPLAVFFNRQSRVFSLAVSLSVGTWRDVWIPHTLCLVPYKPYTKWGARHSGLLYWLRGWVETHSSDGSCGRMHDQAVTDFGGGWRRSSRIFLRILCLTLSVQSRRLLRWGNVFIHRISEHVLPCETWWEAYPVWVLVPCITLFWMGCWALGAGVGCPCSYWIWIWCCLSILGLQC